MFKYAKEFDLLNEDCPPKDYQEVNNDVVYRYVYDSIDHPDNFIPANIKNPKRFLNVEETVKCQSLGLSFYDNLEISIKRFQALRNSISGNIYKTIGTSLAVGSLKTEDGVQSKIDAKHHLTFHPYVNSNYINSFKIINKL